MYVLCGHSVQLMRETVLDVEEVFNGELGETKALDYGLVGVRGEVLFDQGCKGQVFHVPLQGIHVHARHDAIDIESVQASQVEFASAGPKGKCAGAVVVA